MPCFVNILAPVGGCLQTTMCLMEEQVPVEECLVPKQVHPCNGQDVASGVVVCELNILVVLGVGEEQCEPTQLPAMAYIALPVVPVVSGTRRHSSGWRNASDWMLPDV